MKNIGFIIFAAIISYIVGLGIAEFSPTGTSENAPMTCLKGGLIFMILKIYALPYFKLKFIK